MESNLRASYELVKKAIHFQCPERIPVFRNRGDRGERLKNSDILSIPVELHSVGPGGEYSEWGFHWLQRNEDLNFGPSEPNLNSWEEFDSVKWPDPDDPRRFWAAEELLADWGRDRYLIGDLCLSGFSILCLMRGFENLLTELYLEPEYVEKLADKVFGIEEEIIKLLPRYGFDAVGLADDYGTQNSLFISASMWRSLIKPRLERQVRLAHSVGLDVYLHSCGRVIDLIEDFIDCGVDALNLGQVSLNGVEELGRRFAGRICFSCSVSYQDTGVTGDAEQINREIQSYVDNLSTKRGGLILIANKNDALGLRDDLIEQAVSRVTTLRQ